MRTIWLASYPKSGNTWFRILLANLSAEGQPANINDLSEHSYIAAAREPFDDLTLIDSGLLTYDEVDNLRPSVHAELASNETYNEYIKPREDLDVRFVKVHDAYTLTSKGEPLLGGRAGADGAIVIVRDPRDVVLSAANHGRISIDEALAQMNNQEPSSARPRHQAGRLRLKMLAWSAHVTSWLDQIDIPIHLLRYEDLHADTISTFSAALDFARRRASTEQIRRAVAYARFAELRRQELDNGFCEAPVQPGGPFFRRGEVGAWRDELTLGQVARIEVMHGAMMHRLGYRLTSEPNARLAAKC
ncbi:MAG: sulfotransferase domain-containing protein [Xanthobacteraceae bacterium]|jgi:hypothetical protein